MISVNVVSESSLTVGGHGVHTAYEEDLALLRASREVDLSANRVRRTRIQHAHTVGPYATSLLRLGERRVVTAHLTPRSLEGSLRGDRFWHATFVRHLRRVYDTADLVLSVSPEAVGELRSMGVEAPVRVVPNCVDLSRLRATAPSSAHARARLGLPARRPVVVGVGQIQPRKGVDAFVACARRLPHVTFCWVGGTPFGVLSAQRTRMRRLVAEAPANLRFTGQVPRGRVLEYLAAAGLFFLPSRHELCPMSVLEAAALGVPVLLRALPLYGTQFAGLCRYAEEDAFCDAIEGLLGDEALRRAAEKDSAALAEQFDRTVKEKLLLDAYRSLLA